jgi:predicted CXXCH cytochrome family protein
MSQSGHNIKATDDSGSPLNGQLPCAECHETHGSNNIKMLKEELGNVKQTDADKYKTEGTTWTESNERQFCLKCHTNSTQIYGKTSTLNVTIPGHQPGDTQGCSTCHGGSTKSFIEAAHSPTKLTP